MKTKIVSHLFVLIFFCYAMSAQNDKNVVKNYKVWITLVDGSIVKGKIYSAETEHLRITKRNSFDTLGLIIINAEKIDAIKIRKKGKVGKGILIGTLSGLGVGAIIASADNRNNDSGAFSEISTSINTAVYMTGGILVGAGVGAIAAPKRELINVILIDGDIKKYQNQIDEIRRFAFTSN